ncbi:MAG: maltose alpha-D-glucosyltransferase [Anaerolineae bacterium]|nr:maltose alpha-D-glucosyltransferase [Anaerolineae bacterium]
MNDLWYKTAVFYELNIRAYQDSNGDGIGDFRGAIQHLDHIQSLGVNCIWIMPHYASPLKDDGYDIADYYEVYPAYGTLDDFKAFVAAAHERGLKVVTDLVTNHTSDQHHWFQEARKDKNSPYRDYYVWSDTGTEYSDARIIFLDTEPSNWTYDEVAGQYFWHRFYSSQPDLNYDNPQVHEEMFNVIRHWLDMGLDGFRVDAIPYLYEREGTNCENLPETHAFLQKMRRMVDAEYPGRVLIAEANQWPEDLLPYFGTEENPEFQICFHFPIMPRLYQAVKAGDKTPIEEIWARTPDIPANAQWMTFLRNHDELTLEMVTPEVRQWMWEQYAPDPRMKLNLGIRRRLAPLLDDNKAKWFLLHALFLSLPGTPIVYYGDEIGMGDNIWLPDRHGCRTPMQWNDEPHGGFSNAKETYFPAHSDPVYGYQVRNVAAQEKDPASYLNLMRFLIQTRGNIPAFGDGKFEFVATGNSSVLAYTRTTASQTVLCLFNLSDQPQTAQLNLPQTFTDLLAANPAFNYELESEGQVVKLAPFAAHWLV